MFLPQISRIIQYKTLRSVIFDILYVIPYYLYEVSLHYKAKEEEEEEEENQFEIIARPGIDPSPLVPKPDRLTTRRAPLLITVHIGRTIRVSATFVFAYRVNISKLMSPGQFICI